MAKTELNELAEYLVGNKRRQPKLTGTSGASGRTDRESRVRGLPMPLGSEGEILTIINDGGDIVASWEPASSITGVGARYLYTADIMDTQPTWLIVDGIVLETA